jgi:Raf kinase inhibitor-like YbhB/YbcL family protein
MIDRDSPGGQFVHWTQWGHGTTGTNSFGKPGYSGPCPPKGDKPHRYVVTVYALGRRLGLPQGASADKVLAAVHKDALASGSVTGTYSR